ncbi:Copal-8-ol diphosphate hydratase, chloroplastic [Capsicum chinense]|nr:Copal-8-ol diphosphate hydratase, chloroplastic [Capsicum chinense]
MLSSMEDGRSSVSPYDTAWVSFIQDYTNTTNINGIITSKRPLFPSCLQWIVDNQLVDGSWGEELVFCIYDRLLNTLACVVALTLWNTCLPKRNKGVMFIKENLRKLETGEIENMTCGFEFVFPALLEKAQQLDIDIPYDALVLKDIYARREVKFTRIPKDVIHTIPTTMLFSLEGLRNLDWPRLLKLQMEDGSFLTCPSSTAIAFMETNDDKCFKFLKNVVEKCNGGGVMFIKENLRKLETGEIENMTCGFEFVFPALLEKAQQLDIDIPYDALVLKDIYARREVKFTRIPKDVIHTIPTTMLFSLEGLRNLDWPRLLKLQMEDGSFLTCPSSTAIAFMETNDDKCFKFLKNVVEKCNGGDVLNKFKDGDQFFCLRGELNKSPTAMFNLYRCSQALFPGEKILEEAKNFSYNFLQQCLANNQSTDKWVIAKDIPGELRYALEFPWYASLPRVESRIYIDQYGGADELWIGKTIYRMPDVSNNVYLQAAKLDYNRCQSQHRFEWVIMQEYACT